MEIKAGMFLVTKDEYEKLLNNSRFLDCLRSGGVDNWDGWDDAVREYHSSEVN